MTRPGSAGKRFSYYARQLRVGLLVLLVIVSPAYSSDMQNESDKREIVVLIHGLLRTSLSMWPMKMYLEKRGYQVEYYSYVSARYTIHEHSLLLHHYIEDLLAKNPDRKVHFITHSMGGIMTREALSTLSKQQLQQIGKVVMLAPPNQGSDLAKYSLKAVPILTYFVKPLPELSSDANAYVHKVPVPKVKIGIIAGRYDAKAPPSAVRLQGTKLIVINSTHTFIMVKAKTMRLALNFLRTGSFKQDQVRSS